MARLARERARRASAQRDAAHNLEPNREYERARERAAANPATSAGRLVRGVLGGSGGAKLSRNQLAARAWYSCNGDMERRHTTGVYLRAGRNPSAAPVMGVYVDSHAYMQNFLANRDLYLSRLAFYGFQVSGIEFRLSKKQYVAARQEAKPQPKKAMLAPLSGEERHEVDQLVGQLDPKLPDSLKKVVSRAVSLSFQRQKARKH